MLPKKVMVRTGCSAFSDGLWFLSLFRSAYRNSRPESAHGIALYISNSPFVSWLSIFGIRGEAYLLGSIELTTATLLAAGAFIPILSALGSLMGIGTFAITWSFFFSTPGVVKWSLSTDPIAWNLTGEFLFKDVVLLCVCILLFLASLPKKVVPLR
jgi:uncharacterized membrane protein YkgB